MKYTREIMVSTLGAKSSKYTGGNLPQGFYYEVSPYDQEERIGKKNLEDKIDDYIKRKINLPGQEQPAKLSDH